MLPMISRLLITTVAASCLYGQRPAQPVTANSRIPDDVLMTKATIMSEGTRMGADTYILKANAGKKLPSILMAHGWGGTAAALRMDAVVFAQAGYYVVAFDYRGWGESDSRLILTAPAPPRASRTTPTRFTAEVQEVREVVDPLDFAADWQNAMHWLVADSRCDVNRIGVWGSSFSGGLVVWLAARDARVKALHSQVGSLDGRSFTTGPEQARTYEEASRMARGEAGYPAPRAKVIGNLQGAPIRSRFIDYAPVDDVVRAPACAMQFLIAEKEELFDNKDHAIKAYERHKGPKKLISIPNIAHYGIYYEKRLEAQKLALDWFDQWLKK